MFRLKVKVGKQWKLGINLYPSFLDAQIRQEELRLKGITSKIADSLGKEVK